MRRAATYTIRRALDEQRRTCIAQMRAGQYGVAEFFARGGARMRIIAGRLRGRDLGGVAEGVRPTADRVRESLFSVLGSLDGLRVLDLCAGTGALGLEAYSRGAECVVWVEKSRGVARDLSGRLASLGLGAEPGLRVVVADVRQAIARLARERVGQAEADRAPFDLVFYDPPYAALDRVEVLEALFESRLLAPRATVVVEGARRHPLPAVARARVVDERRYGDTVLTWLEPVAHEGGA